MSLLRKILLTLFLLGLLGLAVLALLYLAASGHFGERQGMGEIAAVSRSLAASPMPATLTQSGAEKRILFGDLHSHTTYSFDAYNVSLPMYQGEGSHPPGDACDYARFCSGLDFWSINDHAEGLTPQQWDQTTEMVRQCNAAAGDPANPDMVTFLGWEWTQLGNRPENHYGHKNIILRDTAADSVPTRPIAAPRDYQPPPLFSVMNAYILVTRLLDIAGAVDSGARQRYHDFFRYLVDREELAPCASGPGVRELPDNCQESAATPNELFARMDEWGFPYLTIPHGNSWGIYTPPLSSWDKQLAALADPQRQEPLIEVFSGHGNSEQYFPWRAIGVDADGETYCPEPTADFLPECWQAGEIIRKRCLGVGESAAECEQRAVATRANYLAAGNSGHWTVPGATIEDWLDAGQCRDCYMPAYDHRPTSSVQYGLALSDFSDTTRPPKRFRWGIIGSSDTHTARPGNGYKEILRRQLTDTSQALLGYSPEQAEREPIPDFVTLAQTNGLSGPNYERFTSFFGTGGLVAVHATGRDRQAIWDALERKEVYGTSGDRILLWFDLVDTAQGGRVPMGSSLETATAPQFEVSALGAFEQKPGCPADSVRALAADRLQRLCSGECYYPDDQRKRIDRIEVVRIRPQASAGEPVDQLIEDPWKVLPCPPGDGACTVRFSDSEFVEDGRDSVYYVRALQQATPTVNGDQLRCERDADGQCIAVKPCRVRPPTDYADDCLAPAQERAWSSPIFVDYGAAGTGPHPHP